MGRDPEATRIFNNAMVSLTGVVAPGVLAAHDFSGIGRLFDVGGGFGELLAAILRAYPSMHGAVCDLARCRDGARKQLKDASVDDRAEFIACDFFEEVPAGADAIIMKSVIHDWDDERGIAILRNCRRSLSGGGRVLLVERLLREDISCRPRGPLERHERSQHAARTRRPRTHVTRIRRPALGGRVRKGAVGPCRPFPCA